MTTERSDPVTIPCSLHVWIWAFFSAKRSSNAKRPRPPYVFTYCRGQPSELIVLLNQRNKYLAGYHSYLPSAYEERWQWSGSARRNRQDENLYRRRRRVYRICSSELTRKLASKGRCPCSILNERSAKSGSSSSAVFVTALTMTGDSLEVAAVVAVASSLAVDTLDSSALPWLFD